MVTVIDIISAASDVWIQEFLYHATLCWFRISPIDGATLSETALKIFLHFQNTILFFFYVLASKQNEA